MAILTCKQTCECISLQIYSKYPIQKSRDRTNPPDLPTLKAYPTPGVGGRFRIFSLKWRERMNLKVPGTILPLGCAILSTRAKTVRGLVQPPLGELNIQEKFCLILCPSLFLILIHKFLEPSQANSYLIKSRMISHIDSPMDNVAYYEICANINITVWDFHNTSSRLLSFLNYFQTLFQYGRIGLRISKVLSNHPVL